MEEMCFIYSMTPYAIENKKWRFEINSSVLYPNENHLLLIHIVSISLEKEKSKNSLRLLYLNNSYSGAMVSKLVMTISLKNCYHF